MPPKVNQRRLIVVNPQLQFRLLLLPLVVTITTAACLLALFIIQAQSLKSFAEGDPNLMLEIGRVQTLSSVAVGTVLLLHVGLILWLGLHATHRVAGPLHKLKLAMAEVASGKSGVRIRFRSRDQLGELAEGFNRMMDTMEGPDSPDRSETAEAD
jgi:nitrogen fixation/metabolism regulation signal transduction histidine kinase